jgi:hypothetical protein
LNSLATVDDFYTNCHVLYGTIEIAETWSSLTPGSLIGIEAILNALSSAMKLKAHAASQIGCVQK